MKFTPQSEAFITGCKFPAFARYYLYSKSAESVGLKDVTVAVFKKTSKDAMQAKQKPKTSE